MNELFIFTQKISFIFDMPRHKSKNKYVWYFTTTLKQFIKIKLSFILKIIETLRSL
jgi:hypothetical protein